VVEQGDHIVDKCYKQKTYKVVSRKWVELSIQSGPFPILSS